MAAGLDLQRTKKRYIKLCFEQCFESGMFMPDPDFIHPGSRISETTTATKEKAEKNFVVLIFF
jgi:hypothetical protein